MDSKSRAYVLAHITLFPINIILVVVELSSYTDKLLMDGRTDRQTDTVLMGRSLSTGRAMRLSSIPAKKNHAVPNAFQDRRPNRTETLTTFVYLPKKAKLNRKAKIIARYT